MEHLKNSNQLSLLVRRIQCFSDLTIAEIAAGIGYTRQHLSREAKKGNAEIEKLLKDKYKEMLQNETNAPLTTIPGIDTNNSTLIKSNATLVETNSKLANALTAYAQKETEVTIASAVPVLEIIAKEGKGRWWQSVDEGRKELGSML